MGKTKPFKCLRLTTPQLVTRLYVEVPGFINLFQPYIEQQFNEVLQIHKRVHKYVPVQISKVAITTLPFFLKFPHCIEAAILYPVIYNN